MHGVADAVLEFAELTDEVMHGKHRHDARKVELPLGESGGAGLPAVDAWGAPGR